MKVSARVGSCLLLAIATSGAANTGESGRFALRSASAGAQVQLREARFSVQSVATVIPDDVAPPRFALKTALADCAPLPDPLFANGFD